MNKRILLSGISIVTSLSLLAGSAFALLDAQALTTSNTFSATTPGLLVDTGSSANSHPNNTSFSQSETGFTASNVNPGYNQNFVFWLRNATGGSVSFKLSAQFANSLGDSTLNDVMLAQFTCTNQNNTGTAVVSGQHTITEWLNASDSLGTLDANDYARCLMNIQLPSSVGNDIAGKTVKFDTQLGITQTVSVTPTP